MKVTFRSTQKIADCLAADGMREGTGKSRNRLYFCQPISGYHRAWVTPDVGLHLPCTRHNVPQTRYTLGNISRRKPDEIFVRASVFI